MKESVFLKLGNEKDLEKVVRYNLEQANKMRKELKLLEEVKEVSNVSSISDESIKEELFEEVSEIEEEYEYYLENLIQDLESTKSIDEKRKAVFRNLPSVENKNYKNIINRIKLELVREMKELGSLAEEDDDKEFLQEIEKEQQLYKMILDFIAESQNEKLEEQVSASIKTENKLFFLKTNSGSIYVENDLYGHDEYFASFRELLLSIENGTFKNVKRLENHSILSGIVEVKEFKTRIFFDRLDKDTYIIIGAIIKKTDTDKGYLNQLTTRISYYRNNKDSIMAQMNDETYLEENKEIRVHLITGLESKKLIKTKNGGTL